MAGISEDTTVREPFRAHQSHANHKDVGDGKILMRPTALQNTNPIDHPNPFIHGRQKFNGFKRNIFFLRFQPNSEERLDVCQILAGANSWGAVNVKEVGLIIRGSHTAKKGNPPNVSHNKCIYKLVI